MCDCDRLKVAAKVLVWLLNEMSRRKGNCLLLVGENNNLRSSFLLQFASHWAESGIRVSYLSSIPFSKLPPPIHGATFPSSSGLNQIQFLYLPRWQDLLQHLFSLHCHALVPRAIILQGLDHYCSSKLDGQVLDKHEVDEGESSHIALLCAALLDALSVCTIRNANQETFCICTYEEGFRESDNRHSLFSPLSVFFDNVWFMRPVPSTCSEGKAALVCSRSCNCQLVNIEKVLYACKEFQPGSNLEFLCKSSAVFLQKIQEMVKS